MTDRADEPARAPRVSFLLPARNAAEFVGAAVDSILAQSFTDFELIVVNDGSTDATRAVVESRDDPRIRILDGPGRGIVPALNLALAHARGELIARMDADDLCASDRLAKQVALLDRHPDVGVVGAAMCVVRAEGEPAYKAYLLLRDEELHRQVAWRGPVCHGCATMRAELVRRVGGYREEWDLVEDMELWRRLAAVTKFANLPDVLYTYRQPLPYDTSERAERQRARRDDLVRAAPEIPPVRLRDAVAALRWYRAHPAPAGPGLVAEYRTDQVNALAAAVFRGDPAPRVARLLLTSLVVGPYGPRGQVRRLRAIRRARERRALSR